MARSTPVTGIRTCSVGVPGPAVGGGMVGGVVAVAVGGGDVGDGVTGVFVTVGV